MHYNQITERISRTPTSDMFNKAKSEGFDTSKLWFHGTRKRFEGFQLPKRNGVDELGPGIYVTSEKWIANTWARKGGFILICVIKKGPLFDLEKVRDDVKPETLKLLADGYIKYQTEHYPHPTTITYDDFINYGWKNTRNRASIVNLCLSNIGYVGGFRHDSQITGQAVIFKPEDVMIIARNGGKDYMYSND